MTHRVVAQSAVVLAFALIGVGLSGAGSTAAAAAGGEGAAQAEAGVTITVRLGAGRAGTFRMRGSTADGGGVVVTRTVSSGTVRTTLRLNGARGTLVTSASRACARATGRWKVVSGTGSYEGASGGGTARGPTGCGRPWAPSTVVYSGALTIPPPPLAPAGAYGGWTPQDEWLEFEVAPSGRSMLNLAVSGFAWDCVSENGRFRLSSKRDRMPGPFPIGDDRTFTIQMWPNVGLSGRFTAGGAEGTITIPEYPFTDAQGKPATCGGTIPWTATAPPPPPRRALPGKYCGSTAGGQGVCLDVLEGGREFRNLRVTALLNCGDFRFALELTLEGTVPLGPTLRFEQRFSHEIPGGDPVPAFLRGSFDQAGTTTGSLTLTRPTFTYEGTRYTCSGGGASWTAKLQR